MRSDIDWSDSLACFRVYPLRHPVRDGSDRDGSERAGAGIVEPYHNTDYDTYMATGIEIPHIKSRTFDICTVSADDLVNDWTGNDVSSLVQAAMSFRITKNDAKWKQGGMTVVPEGATVVDIGLVQVYAWHERTVGTKNQSSDHFVFCAAGDVYHLIRSTKGTTTNVKLTCGRTA